MLTYADVRDSRRELLALTGLTAREFRQLLAPFSSAYGRRHPADRTESGTHRRRAAGGGRKAVLARAEDKLLFVLTHVKAYPLQVVMARLFGMTQPAANHWVHRLLPVLRAALADLGVAPARSPAGFGRRAGPPADRRLIIDGTDRRRQRPKKPLEQAVHYSGKRKTHCDRNVVVADVRPGRVGYLSQTYPCRAHDKAIAEHERIAYPPGTALYQDGGFAGYEPAGVEARRPGKKAARPGADAGPTACQPGPVAGEGPGRARDRRREAVPDRQGRAAEHQGRHVRRGGRGGVRPAQPPAADAQAPAQAIAE